MYEMDQCRHDSFDEKFVCRSQPFSNGNVLKLRVQGIKRSTQLKKQPCELTFSSTITSLRLGEGYKKGSRKDAKSQRKEGSKKSMSFVSIKQYSEDPVHPV
jgi:hypothetical protein